MRKQLNISIVVLILGVLFLDPYSVFGSTSTQETLDESCRLRILDSYGKLPMSFEENLGQTDVRVRFLSRGRGYTLFLTPTEAVLALRKSEGSTARNKIETLAKREQLAELKTAVLKMELAGANPDPKIVGFSELPGKVNYFIGSDPKRWRTNIPTYQKVRYKEVYPGIDLVYYGNQKQLEYDFIVSPGANPEVIRVSFDGADRLELNKTGNLILHVGGSEVAFKKPLVYQEERGAKKYIEGAYKIWGKNRVGFCLASYDTERLLVIDPVLTYSTYLGGSQEGYGHGIAVDSDGNAYVTGYTNSANFPTQNPIQADNAGGYDAFVTKLNAAGSALEYSTYLGGSNFEQSTGIAVDSNGNAYITGITYSTNFPTQNPFQADNAGGYDAFVTKLNAAGSALEYSTYLGGSSDDCGYGTAVDSDGNAYITGGTQSTSFPTQNPIQAQLAGAMGDAFVTKLNASGSPLEYSTYLGGYYDDAGRAIAVDTNGNAYITGYTESASFPRQNPIQVYWGGGSDAFVTKLNAAGSALEYSTYLGGSNFDYGLGIAVDSSGNAYITGYTQSTNFPTQNPFQAENAGGSDVFVTKITQIYSFEGDELAVDFKTTGIYVYNEGDWERIYIGVDPDDLCAFETYLTVDFGMTYGLYVYDSGDWDRIYKGVDIDQMSPFGSELAVDFGMTYGIYEYAYITDQWSRIYRYSAPRDAIVG